MNELEQLITDFLTGDSKTFYAIRMRTLQYLQKHSASKFLDVEDICSETMQILLKNFRSGKFRGSSRGELNTYIFRIVNNHVCDQIKKAQRRNDLVTDLIQEGSNSPDVEKIINTKSILEAVFADLEENCCSLLRMKFLDGLSDQEIADKLDKSKNAISTSISRCIKKAYGTKIIQKMLKE